MHYVGIKDFVIFRNPKIHHMRSILILSLFLVCQFISAQTISFNFEIDSLNSWNQFNDNRWGIDSITPISGLKSLHHIYDGSESGFDAIDHQHNILHFDSTAT